MNRVSDLFNDGRRIASIAILYHAEAEWTGRSMPFEAVLRRLYDRQINYDVIPADVFATPEEFNATFDEALIVNTQHYKALIIPESQFITKKTAKTIEFLVKSGFPVFYINEKPEGTCDGDGYVPDCTVVKLDDVYDVIAGYGEIKLHPENNRIRVLHYKNDCDMYMIVNEGDAPYKGILSVPSSGQCYVYNAYANRIENANIKDNVLNIELEPLKSLIILFDEPGDALMHNTLKPEGAGKHLFNWKRRLCKSIDYPNFSQSVPVTLPDKLEQEYPAFSGFARYETIFEANSCDTMMLVINGAYEGVELFINGISLGIEITPPMIYDLAGYLINGENIISVEVATTLERERFAEATNPIERYMAIEPTTPSGLSGNVMLYQYKKQEVRA
jgi:hypothetical protein